MRPILFMNKTYKWMSIIILTFLLTTSTLKMEEAEPLSAPASSDLTIIQAADLYNIHCSKCHGTKGEGGKGSSLDNSSHAWHHPDGQLYDFIYMGKWGPVEKMPAFKDILKAEEIDEIIVFIKTFWNERQQEVQSDLSSRYRDPRQDK